MRHSTKKDLVRKNELKYIFSVYKMLINLRLKEIIAISFFVSTGNWFHCPSSTAVPPRGSSYYTGAGSAYTGAGSA